MRHFVALLLMLFSLPGCWEAVPDEGTMGELQQDVASFPPEVQDVMARWAANRVALGYCRAKGIHDRIGLIRCYDPDKPTNTFLGRTIEIEVGDMIKCLIGNTTTTYAGCLEWLLTDTRDTYPHMECEWSEYGRGFSPQELPDETSADRVSVYTMTRALLGEPPPMNIQIMLMGLPGMMGPAGALCIQVKREWACAPGPFSDSPGASSATSGGGDR